MCLVFYIINLYMCIYDMFHILQSLWDTYESMECMQVCTYVRTWFSLVFLSEFQDSSMTTSFHRITHCKFTIIPTSHFTLFNLPNWSQIVK